MQNLYVMPGAKVKYYYNNNGSPIEIENSKRYLIFNKVYTIKDIVVRDWSSYIVLEGIPDMMFNTVQFENEDE
jgi:hypothetical protein